LGSFWPPQTKIMIVLPSLGLPAATCLIGKVGPGKPDRPDG
jgi:hypothetical protein